MSGGRLHNSVRNLGFGFLFRAVVMLSGFVSRTVFIYTLGNDYLSISGLYSNILNLLSLAELGFGAAMEFRLYRPIAEGDDQSLSRLLSLYRTIFRIVGSIIFAIGLLLIPFLGWIIRDPPAVGNLTLYYILFLIENCLSYWLFGYMESLLLAGQENHVVYKLRSAIHLGKAAVQCCVLALFHSYLLYLSIQLLSVLLENLTARRLAVRIYPAASVKSAPPGLEERQSIWLDVRGLFINKLGHVFLNSTDNIIISRVVGLPWVGLLYNYTLFFEMATSVLCQITNAIQPSLGNFFVEKNRDAGYALFLRVDYMIFWLYSLSGVMLATQLTPFVRLWAGETYALPRSCTLILALNYFVQGYVNGMYIFRSTLGLFSQGRLRPLVAALLNIALSILLGYVWGVPGVLIATFLSRVAVSLWYDPYCILHHGFGLPAGPYFRMYLARLPLPLLCLCGILVMEPLFFAGNQIIGLLLYALSSASLLLFCFFVTNRNRPEFQFYRNLVFAWRGKRAEK